MSNKRTNTPNCNKVFVSDKRFTESNTEKLTADQLNEQLISLNLPANPPHPPSTFDLFGSDETKYQPSNFIKTGAGNASYVNTVEYNGNKIVFGNLVKAISKNITTGLAKPDRAKAYAKYFAYLSKQLTASVRPLEVSRENYMEYVRDAAAHEKLTVVYDAQLRHEQSLSQFELGAITVEESQEQLRRDTENNSEELNKKFDILKAQQDKVTALLARGDK